MNDVGVNLAQSHEGSWRRAIVPVCASGTEFAQERSPVALDGGSGIIFGEAEIEIMLAVSARESSEARGESVNQPGTFTKVLCANDVEFSFAWDPGWHTPMLTERGAKPLDSRLGEAVRRYFRYYQTLKSLTYDS